MKIAIILSLLSLLISESFGQIKKQALYNAEITTHAGAKSAGLLASLGDSTLQLIPLSQVKRGIVTANPTPSTHAVKDIYLLRFRKKGAAGNGALLGGGVGLLVGFIIGYSVYRPCESSNAQGSLLECLEVIDQTGSTVLGGAVGAIAGAGLGALVGASAHKIFLYGDQETYQHQKSNLEQYVLKTQ